MCIFATDYYKSFSPHLSNATTLPCEASNSCCFVKFLMLEKRNSRNFYCATARNATHGIAVTILSVRLSVRPSVCLSDACIVTKLNAELRIF